MSSGVEIEDGRVPLLFKGAPETSVIGAERSDVPSNSSHIGSIDYLTVCDGGRSGLEGENPVPVEWVPHDCKHKDESVLEVGITANRSSSIDIASSHAGEESPVSSESAGLVDVVDPIVSVGEEFSEFQEPVFGTSPHYQNGPNSRALQNNQDPSVVGLGITDDSERPLAVKLLAPQTDCFQQHGQVKTRNEILGIEAAELVPKAKQKKLVVEGERSQNLCVTENQSDLNDVTSRKENDSRDTSKLFQLVDAEKPIVGYGHQLQQSDCDNSGCVSGRRDIGEDTLETCYRVPWNEQKGLVVEQEREQTLTTEEDNSTWTHIANPGITGASMLTPESSQLVDVVGPVIGNIEQLSLWDCDKSRAVSRILDPGLEPSILQTSSDTSRTLLIISTLHCEKKEAISKLSTIEASTCDLPNKKNALIVKVESPKPLDVEESCSLGSPGSSQLCDVTPPIVGSLQLLSMSDCDKKHCMPGLLENDEKPSIAVVGDTSTWGNHSALARSAFPGSCVPHNEQKEAADGITTIEEEQPSILYTGENTLTSVASSVFKDEDLGSPLAAHASTTISSNAPQHEAVMEFSATQEERPQASSMDKNPCNSITITSCSVVDESTACLESLQIFDDVVGPISGFSGQSTLLACEGSGYVSGATENGSGMLEPMGPYSTTNWIQHDENEIATEFLSVEKEMLFMSVGGKHLGGSTNADFCGMVEESAACLETTQIVGVGPIAGNSKQFGGLENGRGSLAMGKNNTDTVAATLVPAVVNDVVPLKEWKEKLAESFVTEEERPRVSEVNENICSSMEVTSCSLVQEVGAMPPISEKSTLLRSSPRLTRMRSTRTQCRKTLEGIIVSLSKSRKQRSSLCKKARSSNWGVLANIIEVFTRNEELLKFRNSHLDKASKNRSRKVRSGSGKGRKTKTTPSKGNLRLSNRKAGRSNGVSLKLNMGREARLPFLHEPVDIQTAVQAITSGCSQQLNEQVNLEISKMNTKVEPKFSLDSLDGNSGKPILSGEISRDRDLDSTVTQDISVENTSGEFPGVSSQIEVETLTGRDFDPGTSPDSGVLHMIPDHGPFGKKCAISQIDKTDNGDSDPWASSESGVLDKVPSLDVTRRGVLFTHKNSRRKGQIDFVLGSTVQEGNGKLAPAAYMEVHEVMPSNMRQNSRKVGKKNGKAKESTPTLFVKEQFCVVKNVEKDRKYSRRRNPQEMGGVDPKESKSSGSEIFQMEPSVVETAHLRLDLQVSNLEINPGSNEFSGQDINVREYMLPKTSRTGGSKHRMRNPDSVRTSKGNTSEQKKRSAQKSVSKRKAKEKNLSGQVSNKDESHSALSGSTGVSMSDVIGKDREVAVEGVFSSEMLPVGDAQYLEPRPRAAWVSCDDCCKWRCIPAQLADEIELTNCKWTCKDNSDKRFADCSIPQEKSNADINAELEISDASGEEDSRRQDQKPKGFLPMKLLAPQVAPWTLIKHNIFLHRSRRTQTIDEIMVCHCNQSSDRNIGCGDECLNRMLNIECVKGTCPCGDLCSNQQFQKRKYAKFKWFRCGKKGYGLQLLQNVSQGQFLIEYVGEVLDLPTYEARQMDYASRGQKHFYFMTLNGSEVIDACTKGNLGRFINHSCDPNCRTEKWMVNGEVCIGLFALRDIKKGEEVTFDYNYVRVFGAAAKKCVCGSSECRGYIGGDPSNTEAIVQVDSDDEYPEPVMVPDGSKGKNIMPGIIPTQIIPTTALALRNTDSAVESLPFIPKMTLLQTEDSMGVLSSLPLENVEISSQLDQQSEVPLFIEDSTSKPSSLPQLENSSQTEDIISELEPTFKHLELSLPLTEGHSCQTSPALKTSDTSLQMESSLNKSSPVSFPVEECMREPNLTQQFDNSLAREEILAKSLCSSQSVEIISLQDTVSQSLSLFVGDNNKHIKIKGMGKEKPKVAKSSNHEKSSRPLNSVRKGKFNTNQVVAQKPKKQVEGTRSGRFEGVEEKLNELLDSNGGISKRKDATKGYLKLLFVTAASGDNVKGEAFQSTRDLSIVLDALLKTKSRVVLIDIISKNGLQMLHNIMKQNRRNFNKIPIIRKLLKVIEFLAAKEILTLEHINTTPPCAGMESFKESIITLTRHNDMQVHQMARNFRDRWFPRTTRKVYSDRDDEKLDSLSAPQKHFHGSHHRWHDQGARPSNTIYDQGARTSDAIDCISQANHKPIAYTACTPMETSSLGDNNSVEGTKRRRKRKSRWDQPEETNLALIPQTLDTQILEANLDSGMGCNLKRPNTCETTRSQTSEVYSQNLSRQDEMSEPVIEDAPPGFQPLTDSQGRSDSSFATCPNSAVGQPQARYLAHLPVSYGIPWDLVKEIGTIEAEGSDQWAVAPGVPFHPFPPLPPFPRGASRPEEDTQQTGVHQTGSSVGQKDVAAIGANSEQVNKRGRCSSLDGSERRYSRQQKWDYRGDRFSPWARHRNGRGFKGSNNGNSHRGGLNRVVCPEKAREEIDSGSCFKECVEGSGDKAGADHTTSTFYQ